MAFLQNIAGEAYAGKFNDFNTGGILGNHNYSGIDAVLDKYSNGLKLLTVSDLARPNKRGCLGALAADITELLHHRELADLVHILVMEKPNLTKNA